MWLFSKKAPSALELVTHIEDVIIDVSDQYWKTWRGSTKVHDFCPEQNLRGTTATMLFEGTMHTADTPRARVLNTVITCNIVGLTEAMRIKLAGLLNKRPWVIEASYNAAYLIVTFKLV